MKFRATNFRNLCDGTSPYLPSWRLICLIREEDPKSLRSYHEVAPLLEKHMYNWANFAHKKFTRNLHQPNAYFKWPHFVEVWHSTPNLWLILYIYNSVSGENAFLCCCLFSQVEKLWLIAVACATSKPLFTQDSFFNILRPICPDNEASWQQKTAIKKLLGVALAVDDAIISVIPLHACVNIKLRLLSYYLRLQKSDLIKCMFRWR